MTRRPSPFLGAQGDALAADLRSLQAGLPRHGVLLSSLQAASEELDGHEKRIAEWQNAAAAITRALDDYRACHAPMLSTDEQPSGIRAWCRATKEAIDTWWAMTETGERDPALSDTAAVLEDIIAFEGRAHDVAVRLSNARGDDGNANPFLRPEGDALAADLRSLQAGLPRPGVLLSSLQATSEELKNHERSLAWNEDRQRAAAAIEGALDDYATRHGQLPDRPGAQMRSIGAWCDETREAIDTWRAVTTTVERDPALSDTATVLEDLMAFEERARDLHMRWNNARIAGGAQPFLMPDGESLAADLRALKADLSRHAVMLSSLKTASGELDRHEARIAERDKAAVAGRTSP